MIKDTRIRNSGKAKILLAHPASAGHGLNLQQGGHIIVWFGLTWSLELYQQANARLYRQGQEHTTIIHHIMTENTIDQRVYQALQNKELTQDELMKAIKARIDKYSNGGIHLYTRNEVKKMINDYKWMRNIIESQVYDADSTQ